MNSLALLAFGIAIQTPPPTAVIREPLLYYASGSTRPLHPNGRSLDSIIEYARRPMVTTVVVRAHTDTVGSTEDNLGLSRERGQWVVDRLVAGGVRPSIIRIDARGESQLARPTADEVDEPLNRHVWVDISVQRPVR